MNKVFSGSHSQAPYKVKNTFSEGVLELSRAVFWLTQGFAPLRSRRWVLNHRPSHAKALEPVENKILSPANKFSPHQCGIFRTIIG